MGQPSLPFTHVDRVPAEATDWQAQAGMLAVVALLLSIGLVGFARRDLRG